MSILGSAGSFARQASDEPAARANGFNLIRLLAAFSVLYSHSFPLSGLQEPLAFGKYTWGLMGVFVFFSASGYLLQQSWLLRPSVQWFVASRMLRIFPGLVGAVVFCTFVLGPLLSSLSVTEYLLSHQTWLFLYTNIIFYIFNWHQHLPGVFANNPLPLAVNGSLWTIPYELAMYAFFLLSMTLSGTRYLAGLGMVLFFLAAYITGYWLDPVHPEAYFTAFSASGLGPPLLVLGGFFAVGAFFAHIDTRMFNWFVASLLLVIGYYLSASQWGTLFLWFAVPYVTVAIALTVRSPVPVNTVDLSYGMYLYAFPIQQMFSYLGVAQRSWWVGLLMSLFCTFALAVFSWIVIEKPMLRLKTKLSSLYAA